MSTLDWCIVGIVCASLFGTFVALSLVKMNDYSDEGKVNE